MAALSVDERALILAPARLGADASGMLEAAGISCQRTTDMTCLGNWLAEGAGLAIVAEQCIAGGRQSPLQQFIDAQPEWSDLPVVLLASAQAPAGGSTREQLGNVSLLVLPLADEQLLNVSQTALRARRRQYVARDQLLALSEQLKNQIQLHKSDIQGVHQDRKMEAVGQLAGGVAHDFNNLLTSIGGSFELIERHLQQGRPEKLPSLLRMGQDAVGRAARLTHRLLAFSSRQSLESRSIDLHRLLEPYELSSNYSASITLQMRLPADLWPVEADGKQLQVALDNLLLNACEAMPSGGTLSIEVSNLSIADGVFPIEQVASGDYLRLSVIDSGQGMSQATLERAFEPFFSTKPVGQGIGMGLSMVYGFSKQSHGHLVLHSDIGRGTRVDLYLPRFLGESPATTANPGASRMQPHCSEVLLVEDDTQVRQLLTEALCDDGFNCHTAGNANEALQVLHSTQPIALMISDVGLPGMNGRQLAEIARKLRPDLPVLFITGYAETAMARKEFLGPGMQLMCKPFELKQVQERVAGILGKR